MITFIVSLLVAAYLISRFWVFVCIPFRDYSRSYVYNWVLQTRKKNKKGKLLLDRLHQRKPKLVKGGWQLMREDNRVHGSEMNRDGFIKLRKVNTFQFYLVAIFLWSALDDDSNQDTTDKGFIETLTSGKRKLLPILPVDIITIIFKDKLKIDFSEVVYGNSFDLGDTRAEHPFFNFFATLAWNSRNPFMNIKYLWMDY